jgi:hypothetical protein
MSSCISMCEVRLLDQKKIDQHAIAIEKKVTRDYYIRMALVGMVAGRVAYAGITWLNTPFEKKSENLIPVQQQKDSPEVPKLSWEEWACNVKTSWVNWGKYVVSKENVKKQAIDFGKFACGNVVQTGISFVMEGVYGKLNYPNTLRWYICSHVPYTATIKVIKELLTPLQDQSSLMHDQVCYNKQLLQEACNRLVYDGEKLCAYMIYKAKQLGIEEQQIAERTTRYFFNYYNEFLQRLSDQLASDVIDCAALDTMLISFEADIKRQFKLFFYIEGETDEERAMIGEKMKRSLVIEHIASLF